MEDKTLTCQDCNQEFVWTAGEQEFYKEKGFQSEPKRCPACRKANKERHGNHRNNNKYEDRNN